MITGTNGVHQHIHESNGQMEAVRDGIFLWVDPICKGAPCFSDFLIIYSGLILADSSRFICLDALVHRFCRHVHRRTMTGSLTSES